MQIIAKVECPIVNTFRVQQVAGLFGMAITERASLEFEVDVPSIYDSWTVAAITGASGSGKTAIARQAFGDAIYDPSDWPADNCVLDGFPKELSIKDITATLTAVGFSSPPAWVRPYRVLSNGERFRCDLARALLSEKPLVVFDEFTSFVDRTVAKVGSFAVAKAIRAGHIKKRFIAVSCHSDILEWLCPDWTVDMSTRTTSREALRRPDVRLEISGCTRETWAIFKHIHYLDSNLHHSAQCFIATWDGQPAAFCAMMQTMGYAGYFAVSRIVTLPDFQGIGIGSRLMEWCCAHYIQSRGAKRISLTTSHPGMIAHCKRHAYNADGSGPGPWVIERGAMKPNGNKKQGKAPEHNRPAVVSSGRAVITFVYKGARK
jgi:GNAT superfamily N-acetyltransferase